MMNTANDAAMCENATALHAIVMLNALLNDHQGHVNDTVNHQKLWVVIYWALPWNLYYKVRQIPKLKCSSSRYAVVCAHTIEARG